MKKIILFVVASLFTLVAFSQPDFSGSWKLNSSKSKLGDQFSMAPLELIVVQSGNDISIEKHLEFQGQAFTANDKFTLDGKECTNEGWMGSKKKSTAKWADDKKSLTVDSKIPMQDGDVSVTETYRLEGENLIVEMSASSSYGDMTEIQVYDRK